MQAMADLVAAKKVRTVGVSNFSAANMRAAHAALASRGIPLVSNQVKYSLLDRRVESAGVINAAKELGITIIAYSPLEQGLLSGKFHDDPSLIRARSGPRKWMSAFRARGLARSRPVVDVLREIAKAHGVTASQVALNWTVNFHGPTVVAIPGASRPGHIVDNVASLAFDLTDTERRRIDDVSRSFL
jgi:aryl-alcohol dehydrogenase-like predicted oxidoreductase